MAKQRKRFPSVGIRRRGNLAAPLDGPYLGRLDVSMNEVVMMSFREGLSQLDGDIERSGRR